MNVFVSWSGTESKTVATALRQWLPRLFETASVWMSDADAQPGRIWQSQLHQQLSEADFGIVCVNPKNQTAPWLLYETGCLAMRVRSGLVIPYLSEMDVDQLAQPLGSFQSVPSNKSGTRTLVEAINRAQSRPIDPGTLAEMFERQWPDLEGRLSGGVSIAECDGIPVVRINLARLLDDSTVGGARKRIQKRIEEGMHSFVIDLTGVKHVSSAAFSAFLLHWRTAARFEGCVVFCASEVVAETIRFHRLDRVLSVHTDLASAVREVKQHLAQRTPSDEASGNGG